MEAGCVNFFKHILDMSAGLILRQFVLGEDQIGLDVQSTVCHFELIVTSVRSIRVSMVDMFSP